jgi:hypothetical protein
MPRANEAEFLNKVLMGRADAVEFCRALFRVSQVWDDLIDKDRGVDAEDINRAFWTLIVDLPANPFYRANFGHLHPVLRQYIIDWLDATALEREEGAHGKNLAFVLRDSIGAVVTQCAWILGGYEYMRQVSCDVRRHIHEDSLEEYINQLRNQ